MVEAREVKGGVDLARVRAAIAPVLSSHDVALVDLEWTTERTGWVLRLFIERVGTTEKSGGIDLAHCTDVSRDVSTVLDVEDFIAARYHLEVSSPGLDRPLRTRAEFRRFEGELAKLKLHQPAHDGQIVLRGTIVEAAEETIALLVDGKRFEVPFANIASANLVFELTVQPKKGKRDAATQGSQSKKGSASAPSLGSKNREKSVSK